MRMLNKKKYQLRCNFFIVSITLFIIVFFIKTMCGSYITQWNQNKLFEVINTSTYENLYIDEKMYIHNAEDDSDSQITKSVLFYDGSIVERTNTNGAEFTKKYYDGKQYSYIDDSWYMEPENETVPEKLQISADDFEGIKTVKNMFVSIIKNEPIEYVCKVKKECKDKYIPSEISDLITDEDIYIIISCNIKNKSVKTITFTYTDKQHTIDFEETMKPVTQDILVSAPEYSVDVQMIEETYGEGSVKEASDQPYTEKLQLYNNYENYISDITIPAGFEYDEEISTKSEIYLNELEGYGEIILKGKCDTIVEKMLTEGLSEYEENSCTYKLNYLFSTDAKNGSVDLYSYSENKDELGESSYYIGITYFEDQIVEIMFVDMKLEFSQQSATTLLNYIF